MALMGWCRQGSLKQDLAALLLPLLSLASFAGDRPPTPDPDPFLFCPISPPNVAQLGQHAFPKICMLICFLSGHV